MKCLICKEPFEPEESDLSRDIEQDLCGDCVDDLESMDLEDQFELLMEV